MGAIKDLHTEFAQAEAALVQQKADLLQAKLGELGIDRESDFVGDLDAALLHCLGQGAVGSSLYKPLRLCADWLHSSPETGEVPVLMMFNERDQAEAESYIFALDPRSVRFISRVRREQAVTHRSLELKTGAATVAFGNMLINGGAYDCGVTRTDMRVSFYESRGVDNNKAGNAAGKVVSRTRVPAWFFVGWQGLTTAVVDNKDKPFYPEHASGIIGLANNTALMLDAIGFNQATVTKRAPELANHISQILAGAQALTQGTS